MRSSPRLLVLALAALALAGAACKQQDSILFVTVYGPTSVMATELSVTILAGSPQEGRNITVQPKTVGDVITLPASFTVALDHSITGPISIRVTALDSGSNQLAAGITQMQHIQIGGQTDISVQLLSLPIDMPDGGTGPSDAGGGGSGGMGGSAGMGGMGGAGQGGASGRDAAAEGGADAMGLDGATD